MVELLKILPGTGRGTDRSRRRRLVEGALRPTESPLHRLLRSRSPSPFRGGFGKILSYSRSAVQGAAMTAIDRRFNVSNARVSAKFGKFRAVRFSHSH